MKYDIAKMARLNGMSKEDFTDQICKNFIALMEMKMAEPEGTETVILKFGEFTVMTKRTKDE